MRARALTVFSAALLAIGVSAQSTLPSGPLTMRDFRLQFDPAGTFSLSGIGWPAMTGTWKIDGKELTLQNQTGPANCAGLARYTLSLDGPSVGLDVLVDPCKDRTMILDRSRWLPPDTVPIIPPRQIVRTAGNAKTPLRAIPPSAGDWPSFRGREASGVSDPPPLPGGYGAAGKQNLPDTWNPATGENVLWRTPIPGLAHSSPIVWGDTLYVTSAISSRADATFKPGLYGDGDASDDRSVQRWMLYAIDKRTGKIRWKRTAAQSEPRNKRHIKSTYASASPATDGRIVVAWFGSQGIHAYDLDGGLRWSVDLGRVDMGAYDIPAYEWGPASSPIIWNGMVIVQCDTQADSFLLALNAESGETIWKTNRQELPSWGTPTIVTTAAGPELITNASNRSGYSASPVAADGKIYLSNEDGEMLVIEAGATFKHIATNSIGEMLMATPALSDGVMYVRGVSTLFAITRR